jgi:ferric iron reductase protein FhuF
MIDGNLPMHDALAQLATLYEYGPDVRVGVPDEPGWIEAAALFTLDSRHLRQSLMSATTTYGTTRRDVAASLLFHRYSWSVAGIAVAAYLTHQRLPDLSISNLAVQLDEQQQPSRYALASGRFWAQPNDPAADHPDAMVVTPGALDLARLRGELELHFAPVIDAMRAHAPLGKRAMWLALADNSAWWLNELGERLHRPGSRAAEIAGLTRGAGSRLRGGTRLIEVEADGRRQSFVARGGCCLVHKLPATERCPTCPLLKPTEQYERLRAYVLSQP